MNKASKYHQQAMELAEQGDLAQRRKANDQAKQLFQKAFALEREAALCYVDQMDAEPTRSVLLRSAASLALDCGELREAERLIGAALYGNPPEEICQELRDVLVQMARHPMTTTTSEFALKRPKLTSLPIQRSLIETKPKRLRNGVHTKSAVAKLASKKSRAVSSR